MRSSLLVLSKNLVIFGLVIALAACTDNAGPEEPDESSPDTVVPEVVQEENEGPSEAETPITETDSGGETEQEPSVVETEGGSESEQETAPETEPSTEGGESEPSNPGVSEPQQTEGEEPVTVEESEPLPVCEAGLQQNLDCAAQISNAATASMTRTCKADGSGYESSQCEVSACKEGYELNGNACVASNEPEPEAEPVSFASAQQVIQDFCTSCHFGYHDAWVAYTSEEDWLTGVGASDQALIDLEAPGQSLLLQRIVYYDGQTSSMPLENSAQSEPFEESHYQTLYDWVEQLVAKNTQGSDEPVQISDLQFDERGLSFTATCDAQQTLELSVTNPNDSMSDLSEYQEVTAENGDIFLSMDSLASASGSGIELLGAGIDIWESAIHFNGLRKMIEGDELDLTLSIDAVDNVQHDYAKVGLMVSASEGDLSGEILFLHWSGRAGLAQDWGDGVLDNYNQLLSNLSSDAPTPTPAKLRVALVDGNLHVGVCYGCDAPELQPAATTFTPKTLFIAASSHAETEMPTLLRIHDEYAQPGTSISGVTLTETSFNCGPVSTTVSIDPSSLSGVQSIELDILLNGQSLAQMSQERAVSTAASCSMQEELLAPKLRRLSQTQIGNSIEAVFGDVFGSTATSPQMGDGAKLIGMNFTADKLNVNSLNMENIYDTTRALVTTLLSEHSEISQCAQAQDDACVSPLVQEYGLKLWRRPLSSTETDDFNTALTGFGNNEEKLEFVFNALLMSSNFLFRSEIGGDAGNLQELDNYELVSLLSYALWNSGPDDTLLALAGQASPITEQQLGEQVERMFDDPRTEDTFVEIYKDYLKLDLVLSREKADSYNFSEAVREDILASAEMMLKSKLSGSGDFMDVFAGSEYFINDVIAPFFNTSATQGTLEQTALDGTERYGILNHPAFLAVHSTLDKSGIVKRGVFTLEQLLCMELPKPPDNVMSTPVPDGLDPETTSERELLQITHSAQAACTGCHVTIDPAGFGFENFDAVGRYRTVEKEVVTIDASGSLDVGDSILEYDNSAQYSQALSQSNAMRQCVSRRFLEHYLGQDLQKNSCEFQKFSNLIENSNGSVKDLILALVQLESFSKRSMGR